MLAKLFKNIFHIGNKFPKQKTDTSPLPEPEDYEILKAEDFTNEGDKKSALLLLQDIIKQSPDKYDALCLLGEILLDMNQYEEAEKYYRHALKVKPYSIRAMRGLGILLNETGDAKAACLFLQLVLQKEPDDVKTRTRLALILLSLGNLHAARQQLETALRYDPVNHHAWNAIGILAHKKRLAHEALPCFSRAVEIKPDFSEGLRNLGMTLREVGDINEAEAPLRKALAINPESADFNYCVGIVLHDLGQFDESTELLQRALAIDPKHMDSLVALSFLQYRQGNMVDAEKNFRRALEIEPNHPSANLGLGEVLLAQGNFEDGWSYYEYRLQGVPERGTDYPYPRWQGESIQDKTILIPWEQGLGDVIMFASCLNEVIDQVGHCVIETDPRLLKLFCRSFPSATVHANIDGYDLSWLDKMPAIDLQCPLGSLPSLFRRRWEDFPNHHGYLKADPERVEFWRQRLDALGPGLKVGFSWQGGVAKTGKLQRSMQLLEYLPILKRQDIHAISLQYTDCHEEITSLNRQHGIQIHHWQEAIDDYDETAALVCALDLIISVCTAVVHLTGALGKPALVLAPQNPAWRYLTYGERMPWYPSVYIIRQTQKDYWQDIVEKVDEMLDKEYIHAT